MQKNGKKLVSIILAVLIMLTAAPLTGFVGIELPDFNAVTANAAENSYLTSGYCGDTSDGGSEKDIYWELSEDGVLTLTGMGKIVPEAFNYDLRIKEVVIGDGITNISAYCFRNCSSLKKITMGNNVEIIESRAFSYCSSLETVVFSASLVSIESYGFYNCSFLTELVFPSTLTTIESNAFSGCRNLATADFSDSLISIGSNAFSDCSELSSVIFPDSLKTIGSSAFSNCSSIKELIIPDSVEKISLMAFSNCRALKKVFIGSGITSLSTTVFSSCGMIEEINVSEKNTAYCSIHGVLFNKAKTEIFIVPKKYSGELIIPATVINVPYSAITGCNNIAELKVETENRNLKDIDGILYSIDGKTLLVCPRGKAGDVIVAAGTATIASYAFSNCAYVESITFPQSVTHIESYAFNGCSALTKIELPEKLQSIGDYAFNVCSEVESIVFSDSLTQIGKNAFSGCGKITNLELPDNLISIGANAFSSCKSLTSVILPDSLVELTTAVFSNCTKLESIYVGSKLKKLSATAFSSCSNIAEIHVSDNNTVYSSVNGIVYNKQKNEFVYIPTAVSGVITIPANITNFSKSAFDSCLKITDFYVESENPYYKSIDGILYSKNGKTLIACPKGKSGEISVADGTETIEQKAFNSCHNIKSVVFPTSLIKIEQYAFNYCVTLVEIEFPLSLVSIGDYAFYYCRFLESIVFPSSLKEIGKYAFGYCDSIVDISFSESIEFIGESAFAYCSSLKNVDIPSFLTIISDNIFYRCGFVDFVLPETVQSFDHSNWENLKTLTIENKYCEYTNTSVPSFGKETIIRSYCGSPGHELAVKRLLAFESLGHTYLDWYVATPATYEADGIMRRDCAYCDEYEEKVIPQLVDDVYTATFVAGGEVVSTVNFPEGTTTIEEPKVPEKDRYLGDWEEYTLTDSDITINAVYTLIKSDDASEIEADSEIVHYTGTDDVLLKLRTSAEATVVKSTITNAVPLDIVLVVDQSGSMDETLGGKTKKVDALKETAADFVNTVFENAKMTEADHRISIVGFGLSGTYQGYEKNENTELLTSANGIVKFDDIKTTDYASSLLSVNVNDAVNEALVTAIDSIGARGATAADLGLEMAKGIFANTDSTDRQRVVIFMTDGEPTYLSGFQTSVANSAIMNAYTLKNAYDASVYSVGVFTDSDSRNININKFMNAVSSGYPEAQSMSYMGNGVDGQYYITVNNTDSLTSVFKTISTESLSHTAPFDDVTIIKTLSENVTMTSKQEEQLRIDLIRKYGITNDDITITKNEDGTTTIQVNHLSPYKVTDEEGNVTYEIAFEFFASLNEKTAEAGDYTVDTEDSGVMLGSDAKGYETTFDTSVISVASKKTRIIFTVNGEVYEVSENISNGYAVAPELEIAEDWTFSGWDTSAKVMNGTILNATLTKAERTVTWHTADGDIVQTYVEGNIITAPVVEFNADGDTFLSWDKSIPTTMPDENLEFTAVYGGHVHNYTSAVTKKMTCTENGVRTFTCVCGDTYEEVITAIGHNYEAITPSLEKNDAKCTFCCTNCGDKYDYALDYQVVEATGKKTRVLYEFQLTDDELNTEMQPDGEIQIRIPLTELHGDARRATVIRTNDDGSKTEVPAVVENGFLVITCDHFTPYEVIFDIPCEGHIQGEWVVEKEPTCTEEGHKYAFCTECEKRVFEEDIEKLSHTYTSTVTAPTCIEKGFTTYTCECGDSYKGDFVDIVEHNDNDGDEFCDYCDEFLGTKEEENKCSHMCHQSGFIAFIWKIINFFCKLFGINPVCECGKAHY